MKNKFIKTLLLASSLITVAAGSLAVAVSCQKTNEIITDLNVSVPSPWTKGFKKEDVKFFKLVASKYNNLKSNDSELKDTQDLTIDFSLQNDNKSVANNIITGKSQIAFITSAFLNSQFDKNTLYLDKVKPILLTKTFAPKHDTIATYYNYENNSKMDNIVAAQNADFTKKPYPQWTDSEYQYNYGVYKTFYEPFGTDVTFQRGAIFIAGTDEQLKAIKNAWNKRDWNTFRNFGIVKNTATNSSSKFIYPEFLFKKHFNLKGNSFEGFSEDAINNRDKYASYPVHNSATNMGQEIFKNFHIFLGEENEYAYHHNDPDKNNFTRPEGEKIEILTLTDPYLFFVVVGSNDLTDSQVKFLQKAFLEVANQKQDDFGYRVGISSYTADGANKEFIKEFYLKAKA